jgi:hypothetical protein
MSLTPSAPASICSADLVETKALEIVKKIEAARCSPCDRTPEDCQDTAQGVVLRLLEQAKEQGDDLVVLLEKDPELQWRKLHAERSKFRRNLAKAAKEMSVEMEQSLPAPDTLSEMESAEVIEKVTECAKLSPREREFIHLRFTLGIEETAALSLTVRSC